MNLYMFPKGIKMNKALSGLLIFCCFLAMGFEPVNACGYESPKEINISGGVK